MHVLGKPIVVALVAVLFGACGDDDTDGDDPVALCKEACDKLKSLCSPDAGGDASCESTCGARFGGADGGSCSNKSDITTAHKTCMEQTTCSALTSCLLRIPQCQG